MKKAWLSFLSYNSFFLSADFRDYDGKETDDYFFRCYFASAGKGKTDNSLLIIVFPTVLILVVVRIALIGMVVEIRLISRIVGIDKDCEVVLQ